jgi:hypothetical protein
MSEADQRSEANQRNEANHESVFSLPKAVLNEDGKTCSILYNNCYGGFGYSQQAMDEYTRRKQIEDPTFLSPPSSYYCSPNDPLMIQLFREYGSTWMSDRHSKIAIKTFPAEYYDCLSFHEYDGRESVSIDYCRYVFRRLKELLAKNETTREDIHVLYANYAKEIEKGW